MHTAEDAIRPTPEKVVWPSRKSCKFKTGREVRLSGTKNGSAPRPASALPSAAPSACGARSHEGLCAQAKDMPKPFIPKGRRVTRVIHSQTQLVQKQTSVILCRGGHSPHESGTRRGGGTEGGVACVGKMLRAVRRLPHTCWLGGGGVKNPFQPQSGGGLEVGCPLYAPRHLQPKASEDIDHASASAMSVD